MTQIKNIMVEYERKPDKFIEVFGNICMFMINNGAKIFLLESVDTDNSFGIKIGIDVADKTTLLANPPDFESELDPTKISDLTDRTIPVGLWKMYNSRKMVRIALTNINSVRYYTAMSSFEINEDRTAIGFHNYVKDTEKGYRTNGVVFSFTIDGEDLQELRKEVVDDNAIFGFIRIYLLTWFKCQPNLYPQWG